MFSKSRKHFSTDSYLYLFFDIYSVISGYLVVYRFSFIILSISHSKMCSGLLVRVVLKKKNVKLHTGVTLRGLFVIILRHSQTGFSKKKGENKKKMSKRGSASLLGFQKWFS